LGCLYTVCRRSSMPRSQAPPRPESARPHPQQLHPLFWPESARPAGPTPPWHADQSDALPFFHPTNPHLLCTNRAPRRCGCRPDCCGASRPHAQAHNPCAMKQFGFASLLRPCLRAATPASTFPPLPWAATRARLSAAPDRTPECGDPSGRRACPWGLRDFAVCGHATLHVEKLHVAHTSPSH
jgi:hypothetical protein